MNKYFDASKETKGMLYIRTKHPDGTTFSGIVLAIRNALSLFRNLSALKRMEQSSFPKNG